MWFSLLLWPGGVLVMPAPELGCFYASRFNASVQRLGPITYKPFNPACKHSKDAHLYQNAYAPTGRLTELLPDCPQSNLIARKFNMDGNIAFWFDIISLKQKTLYRSSQFGSNLASTQEYSHPITWVNNKWMLVDPFLSAERTCPQV